MRFGIILVLERLRFLEACVLFCLYPYVLQLQLSTSTSISLSREYGLRQENGPNVDPPQSAWTIQHYGIAMSTVILVRYYSTFFCVLLHFLDIPVPSHLHSQSDLHLLYHLPMCDSTVGVLKNSPP